MNPSTDLSRFIADVYRVLPILKEYTSPWRITADANHLVQRIARGLGEGFQVKNGAAIHSTAMVEPGVMIKPPAIIGPQCFVGSHSYLRGGVFLAQNVIVGPSVEIKSSIVFGGARLAHLAFIGDSIIGQEVNLEAGVVLANHENGSQSKQIKLRSRGPLPDDLQAETDTEYFGALIGDLAVVGANSVLNPGSIVSPGTVIGRLERYPE